MGCRTSAKNLPRAGYLAISCLVCHAANRRTRASLSDMYERHEVDSRQCSCRRHVCCSLVTATGELENCGFTIYARRVCPQCRTPFGRCADPAEYSPG